MKIMKWLFIISLIFLGIGSFLFTDSFFRSIPQKEVETQIIYVTKEVVKNDYQLYEVTGYTAGFESTGKTIEHKDYQITASGKLAWENHTIACPKSLPFGTKVYIKGIDNIWTCEDRGSAITEGHIDIFFEDLDRALNFGRQKMLIMILP
jgi:3D (Asp-Asp-Asp) domain-containing protein